MQVLSIHENRKLFGVFAIGMLVGAVGCGRTGGQLPNKSQVISQIDRRDAMLVLIATANPQTGSTASQQQAIEVKLSEYKIDMPRTALAGSTRFMVTNAGKELHSFEIEGNGIEQRLGAVNRGETKTLLVELKPGRYKVYCPIPGHKSHGMSLNLKVR